MKSRMHALLVIWLLLALSPPVLARQDSGELSVHGRPADVPAAWKGLIGEYVLNNDTISVFEQDGLLGCTMDSGRPLTLTAETKDTFRASRALSGSTTEFRFRRLTSGFGAALESGSLVFKRIFYGGETGSTFRIKPLKPVKDLRAEALRASPPAEHGEFRKADLVELTRLDTTIHLDVRYATTNNFMGAIFYSAPRAFLQRPAAEALVRVNRALRAIGYGLLVHDAYRPWYVTKMFWDATPKAQRDFVADPAKGSRHNRGCAVDLSLYDLKTGRPIEMVSGYDEFSHRAYPTYPGGTALQRWHRALLREAMEAQGFKVFDVEWWHFDYKDWRSYPIGALTFEEIH